MALFSTDIYTGQSSVNAKDRPLGSKVTGDIRMCEAIYTTGITEVATDVIQFAKLPVGAILLPEKCWFFTDGVGGTAVVFTSIGDALDAARYATVDIALTAASTVPIFPTVLVALLLTRFPVTATSNVITGTLAGTFPMTAGKKIVIHLEYRMP